MPVYFPNIAQASATLDFPSIAASVCADLTVTVESAEVGDRVIASAPAALATGLAVYAFVTADDTVTIRLCNVTAGAIDPASAVWFVSVFKE